MTTIDGRSWFFSIGPVSAAERLVVMEIRLASGGLGKLPHRGGRGRVKDPFVTTSA